MYVVVCLVKSDGNINLSDVVQVTVLCSLLYVNNDLWSFFECNCVITKLFFGLLKSLLEVAACVWTAELEDERAVCRRCAQLQFSGQEGHAESQGLLFC